MTTARVVVVNRPQRLIVVPVRKFPGSPGTTDHSALTNRNLADQHPATAVSQSNPELDATEVQGAITELQDKKVNYTDLNSTLNLFPTTAASDIPTYVKMASSVDDPDFDNPAVDIPTGTITGTGQLIASLASDAGLLSGNPGVLNVTTVGKIRRVGGSGVAQFYYEIYHRDNLGVETLISTSDTTAQVDSASYEQFFAAALMLNGDFNITDRIVIKYYGNRVPGGSDPSYEFQFGGDAPVRTQLPIPLNVAVFAADDIKTTAPDDGVLAGQGDAQVSFDEINALSLAKSHNGFDRHFPDTLAKVVFSDAGRSVTISPKDGKPYFEFWSNARRFRKTGSDVKQPADVSGLYIFYYDDSGVIQVGTASYITTILTKYSIVSVGYWNATQQRWTAEAADEQHDVETSGYWHWYQHKYIGAIFDNGLGINGLAVGSGVYTGFDSGQITDEDIQNVIDAQTTTPMWYLDGTEWNYYADSLNIAEMGVTRPKVNEITGGVGSQVEIGNNNYGLTHFLATNNTRLDQTSTFPLKNTKVQGQNEYNTIAQAREGAAEEIKSLILTGLPVPEFVFLFTVIFDDNGEIVLTDLGTTALDWRGAKFGSALAPNSHTDLLDKDIDGHPIGVITSYKYAEDVAHAGGTLTITHNLNTTDLQHPVITPSGGTAYMSTEWDPVDANNVEIYNIPVGNLRAVVRA